MITSIRIVGIDYDVNDLTKKYVTKRIGRLDRYIPRNLRRSVVADVKLQQVNHDHGNKYAVEVVLSMDGNLIVAKDSTSNIMAAIDIVEAKLVSQLSDYKFETIEHLGRRNKMNRFRRFLK